MRIAHIIMAHHYPEQLLRLIQRLGHPQSDFYVHLDKKTPIDEFEFIKEKAEVTFIKNRVKCNWGGNSFLKAIITSLNEVISLNKEYDFINLISAQDYPIASTAYIYDYLKDNLGKNYISFELSKESDWWQKAALRYEKYHFTDFNFKSKYFFEKLINQILPKRKFPGSLELYGSSKSSWWTISGECSKYVAQKLTNDKKLWNFLKYSWGSDEFVITSIIMNSDFKNKVVNDNLRYIDWSEGKARPKILGIADFDKIKNSGMIFARKFDSGVDHQVLEKIDMDCLNIV